MCNRTAAESKGLSSPASQSLDGSGASRRLWLVLMRVIISCVQKANQEVTDATMNTSGQVPILVAAASLEPSVCPSPPVAWGGEMARHREGVWRWGKGTLWIPLAVSDQSPPWIAISPNTPQGQLQGLPMCVCVASAPSLLWNSLYHPVNSCLPIRLQAASSLLPHHQAASLVLSWLLLHPQCLAPNC